MNSLILLLAFGVNDNSEIITTDIYDYAVVHHYYDDRGRHVFDQLVIYHNTYVVDWFMVRARREFTPEEQKAKNLEIEKLLPDLPVQSRPKYTDKYIGNAQHPRYNYKTKIWEARCSIKIEGDESFYYLRFNYVEEMWTQYDIELEDRARYENEHDYHIYRRKLPNHRVPNAYVSHPSGPDYGP